MMPLSGSLSTSMCPAVTILRRPALDLGEALAGFHDGLGDGELSVDEDGIGDTNADEAKPSGCRGFARTGRNDWQGTKSARHWRAGAPWVVLR